jgi:hypothetical protein
MKLYLAAPYAARDVVGKLVWYFENSGHEIVTRWLQGTREIQAGVLGASPDSSDDDVQRHARMDLQDILTADALVHFTASYLVHEDPTLGGHGEKLHTGGRQVETGFALAQGTPVIVIGEPENVFQRGLCICVPTVGAALAELREIVPVH